MTSERIVDIDTALDLGPGFASFGCTFADNMSRRRGWNIRCEV